MKRMTGKEERKKGRKKELRGSKREKVFMFVQLVVF